MSTFQLDEYLRELEQLVNIDSHSFDPAGVARVADFFRDKYEKLGWQVVTHEFAERVGPCLEIANRPAETYDFLLLGHMDTVFPAGTAAERPFRIDGDRAYGPGVIDMQSGLLSMYYTVAALQDEWQSTWPDDWRDRAPAICVALNSDEEISSVHSRPWVEQLAARSRYGFVFEAARPGCRIVVGRKGVAKYAVRFHGKAAHAGEEPEKGASAIGELGHAIVKLQVLTDLKLGTTVNVGVVSGGTGPNVVAEFAEALVDVRYVDEAEYQRVAQAVGELQATPVVAGVTVEIEQIGQRPPWNPDERTRRLQDVFEEVAVQQHLAFSWISSGAASDANLVAAQGTPVIDSVGPVGGLMHSEGEFLEVDSIVLKLELIVEVVQGLVKPG